MTALLQVRGLRKRYGERVVVDGLDLDVAAGEAAALVGPNGSGKTTALRCMLGSERPESGTVELDGRRLDERDPGIRRDLAQVMDDLEFFPDLSVAEHLDLLARAHAVPDPDTAVREVLTDLGLDGLADQLPGTLSSGQRRRLALATAFVRPRRLLILDEPEQRLDAAGLAWLTERLRAEKATGLAVLLATHDTGLRDQVADHVHDLGG